MTRLVIQLLAAVLAVFFLYNVSTHVVERALRPVAPPAASAAIDGEIVEAALSAIPDIQQRSISDFSQTLALPVFFEGRKYPKAQKAPEVPLAETAPPPVIPPNPGAGVERLKLLGVHIDEKTKKVLIAVAETEAHWYSESERVDEWLVQSIRPNEVELTRGAEKVIVRLYQTQSKD